LILTFPPVTEDKLTINDTRFSVFVNVQISFIPPDVPISKSDTLYPEMGICAPLSDTHLKSTVALVAVPYISIVIDDFPLIEYVPVVVEVAALTRVKDTGDEGGFVEPPITVTF
jgi:hypothetical protein